MSQFANHFGNMLTQSGGDAVQAGLGAVSAAGGDVQKYADTLNANPPPQQQAPDQQQAAAATGPDQAGRVFPVQGFSGPVQDHWGSVLGGSDLMAPRGTPIVVMEPGKVIESGWDNVGGNSLLVQGNDGNQYYYAHFDSPSALKVGQQVAAGQYVAPVGNTGDAKGGPTHLHIGIGPDIKLGADKYGGTGGDYNAVGLLQSTLDNQGKSQGPVQAVTSAVGNAASAAGSAVQSLGIKGPTPNTPGDLIDQARQAAQAAGIDPDVFARQIQQESGFNPNAKSGAGALGIAQFMPGTAAGLGINPMDPVQALFAAAKMDAQNLAKYGGDWAKTLAAYNAGGGAVDKYGGVPPYQETQSYVSNILGGAKDVVQNAGNAVSQGVQNVTQGVQQTATDALQQAQDLADQLRQTADQLQATAQSTAQGAGSTLQDTGAKVQSALTPAEQTAADLATGGITRDVTQALGLNQPTSLQDVQDSALGKGVGAFLNTAEQQRQQAIMQQGNFFPQLQANAEAARTGDWGSFLSGTLGLANQITTDSPLGGGGADLSPAVSAGLTAAGIDPNVSRVLGQVANFVAPAALEKIIPAALERAAPEALSAAGTGIEDLIRDLTPEEAARMQGVLSPAGRVVGTTPAQPTVWDQFVGAGGQLHQVVSGDIGDQLQAAMQAPVTDEERSTAQSILDQFAGKTTALGQYPATQSADQLGLLLRQLRTLADIGEPAKDWYVDSSRAIMDAAGGDKNEAEKIAQLVAIYSNRTGVPDNMNRALTAYAQHQAGQAIDVPAIGFQNDNANDLLKNGISWDGAKTNNFYRNLMYHIDPEVWRSLGQTADENGVKQTGATIDIWMQRALNSLRRAPGGQDAYDLASALVNQVGADKGMRPDQAQAAIWTAAKGGWENTPISELAGYHYGTAIQERTAQGFGQGLDQTVNQALRGPNGQDILARAFGLLGTGDRPVAPAARGGIVTGQVEPNTRAGLNALAAARGLLAEAPESGWARLFKEPAQIRQNAALLDAGGRMSPDAIDELQGHLDDLTRAGATRVIPHDAGATVLNTGDAPNKAFQNAVGKAIDRVQSADSIIRYPLKYDGQLFSHDFGADPSGQTYRGIIQQSGARFADQFATLEPVLRQRVQEAGDIAAQGERAAVQRIRDIGRLQPAGSPPVTVADLGVRSVTPSEARSVVGQAFDPSGRVTARPPAEGEDNPFALRLFDARGGAPLSMDEVLSHLNALSDRSEANDARIAELQNRLGSGTFEAGGEGSVIRPPWSAGWTNDALREVARQSGVDANTPLWWEKAGIEAGSGELQIARENVRPTGIGSPGGGTQTAAQARAELRQLQQEQDQIVGATRTIEANPNATFYAPRKPTTLPSEAPAAAPIPSAAAEVPANGKAPSTPAEAISTLPQESRDAYSSTTDSFSNAADQAYQDMQRIQQLRPNPDEVPQYTADWKPANQAARDLEAAGSGRPEVRQVQVGAQPGKPIDMTPEAQIARLRLDQFPEDIRQTIADAARSVDYANADRRGVIPDAVANQLAREYANSNSLDEVIANHTPGQAFNTEQIRALRNAIGASGAKVADLAKAITNGDQTPETAAQWLTEGDKLQRLVQLVEGGRAEMGRGMRAFQDRPSLIDLKPDQATAEISRRVGGNPDDLLDAVKNYQQLVDQGGDPIQLAKFWNSLSGKPVTSWDWFKALRYNSMISGVPTVERIGVSGLLENLYAIARESGMALAQGKPDEASAIMKGAWLGLQKGGQNAKQTLIHGINEEQALRGGFPSRLSDRVSGPMASGPFQGEAAKTTAQALEFPGRVHSAIQDISQATAYSMRMYQRAAQDADRLGLTGQQAADHITQFVNDAQLTARGRSAMQDAMDFSRRAAYRGDMGSMGQAMANFGQTGPGHMILPFARVAYNVGARGIDRTPLGALGTAWDVLRTGGRYATANTQAQVEALGLKGVRPFRERAADNVLGSLLTAATYYEATQGNITAAGPSDTNRRNELIAQGWQPYSLKIGNNYVPYRVLGAFAMPLALGASAAEASRYAKTQQQADDPMSLAGDAASRMGEFVANETYLRDIGNAMRALTQPEQYGKSFLDDLATSVIPYGATLGNVATATGGGQPQQGSAVPLPESIQQSVEARIPGLANQLPQRTDTLGRPIENLGGPVAAGFGPERVTPAQNDQVLRALSDAGVAPPAQGKTAASRSGTSEIDLVPSEQREVETRRGYLIQQNVQQILASPTYQQATHQQQDMMMQRAVSNARIQADAEMYARIARDQPDRAAKAHRIVLTVPTQENLPLPAA